METKLIEFKNKEKELLRGILLIPDIKSDTAALMCGGFERSTTTEKKFKTLADELNKLNIFSFRFDYSGCGLSDGNFSDITVKKMVWELKKALRILERKTKCKNIIIFGHSLSGCVIAKLINKKYFNKVVLFAPALNQKELLRFWFTLSEIKKNDPIVKITWQNYTKYFNKEAFQKDIVRTDKITQEHYINSDYFKENFNKNYADLFNDTNNILLIHGDKDDKVPYESITKKFENKKLIENGDHDLEQPAIIKQWIPIAIKFIL